MSLSLDSISGYYPLAIVGYNISDYNFYLSQAYINDYYAAKPRKFSIYASYTCRNENKYVDPTPDDDVLNNYCSFEVEWYVMYIRYEYIQDPHPGAVAP